MLVCFIVLTEDMEKSFPELRFYVFTLNSTPCVIFNLVLHVHDITKKYLIPVTFVF